MIEIETTAKPKELLQEIQKIESALGRQRTFRWGPRTLDIDILLFDNLQFSLEFLTIPHRELVHRLFVLAPLAELTPERVIPGQTETVLELMQKLNTKDVLYLFMNKTDFVKEVHCENAKLCLH